MGEPKQEKVTQVAEISERLSNSSAALFTEYRGLTVAEISQLRRDLSKAGGHYKVFKNTLVKRAVDANDYEGLDSLLTGPTAIAFVDGDVVSVAKVLKEFAKSNPSLILKGGILDGNAITQKEALALAELASREELLARLAGAFQAPLTNLAGLFEALPRSFAYGLKALIDKNN